MHGPKKLEVTIALSGFLFTFFFCVALVKRTSYAAFLVKMGDMIYDAILLKVFCLSFRVRKYVIGLSN